MDAELYQVPEEAMGMRADAWLASVSGRSRSRIQACMEKGLVRMALASGETLAPFTMASRKVASGMVFEVTEPETSVGLVAQDIPLDIVYEDESLLVVNKPAGMVVHPAPGHDDGTLVNALLHHCAGHLPTDNGEERPGIVHRIDQFTSGLLVVAKTEEALHGLVARFQAGAIHKTYLALVHGIPRPASGHVETLIGRSPTHRQKMAVVDENGREAITDYRTTDIFLASNAAQLEVVIATGRTHQIRVHMKHLGYPVIGDPVYGNPKRDNALGIPRNRQLLHSWKLAFEHPVSLEMLEFEAPIPADFIAAQKRLRQ